jgi:hypothetical protein
MPEIDIGFLSTVLLAVATLTKVAAKLLQATFPE